MGRQPAGGATIRASRCRADRTGRGATTRRHPGRPAAQWHAGRDDQRLAGVAASAIIIVVVAAGVSCLGPVIEPAASSRAIRVLPGGGRDAAGSFAQNSVLNTSPWASPRGGLGDQQRVVAPGLDRGGQPGQLRRAPRSKVRVVLELDRRRRPAPLAAARLDGLTVAG